MTSFEVDCLKVAAFVAAFFINRQAAIVLLAHLVWQAAFLIPVNDFWSTIISATIYAAVASVFIKLKSEIRYALFCQACLYYLNSVDYALSSGAETLYYASVPYLISMVDLYIVWQLVKGEPQHVGNGFRLVHRGNLSL